MSRTRKGALLGGSALVLVMAGTPEALAQSCAEGPFATNNPLVTFFNGFSGTYRIAASTSSAVSSAISNVDTVFLTQQGSAFVTNPPATQPNQQAGGVWIRGIGGQVETSTASASNLTFSGTVGGGGGPFTLTQNVTCASQQQADFAGVQVGSDVARLNFGGWNINVGTTAGYLDTRSTEQLGAFPFRTDLEVPFVGTYVVATMGSFFADVMLRGQYYNIDLNSPVNNLHNQHVNARGFSFSANAGYQFQLNGGWFIEPSGGIIISRTKVDAFNLVGEPGTAISGTLAVDDIESQIGRLTLRAGTTVNTGNLLLQPFVSASLFHEFADDTTSTFNSCASCLFFGNPPLVPLTPAAATINTSTSRIGTYAQFSAGVAGQVLNTGWVGFVRGDYRTGEDLEGWTANAGLRYNFVPAGAPPVGKGIYKAPPAPIATAINWTGFYAGGYFGGDYGTSSITFTDFTNTRPRIAGLMAGGQAGYNWQLGKYVVGLEVDAGWTNKTGAKPCGNATGLDAGGAPTGGFSPFFYTCETELDFVVTGQGRLGYAWERALFYLKGGVAWTETSFTANCIAGPNNGVDRSCFSPNGTFATTFGSDNIGRLGLAGGWGTEFALTPNWSAKAEYNFIGFGKETFRTSDGSVVSDRTTLSEVKVGVNYHFSPMGGL